MEGKIISDIHKNFLSIFLKNPQPGDTVKDSIATSLGLPEKIGTVLRIDKLEGTKYANIQWIGYTNESDITDEDLVGLRGKKSEWVLFSDIEVTVKAIDE